MIRRARRLAIFVLAVASVILLLLQLRLFQHQILDHRAPDELLAYQLHTVKEERERGVIRDRRGGVLACSLTAYDLYAWSEDVRDVRGVAQALHQMVGVDPHETGRLLRTRRWARLVDGILDPGVIQELRGRMRRGSFRALQLKPSYRRQYPRGGLLAPLVGFVNHEHEGVAGLEQYLDRMLLPDQGLRMVQKDNLSNEVVEPDMPRRPALPGATVTLTIDPLLQVRAERAVERLLESKGGRWGQALVVDPRSGEILALAQRPAPVAAGRPTRGDDLKALAYRNLATQEMYAPGSSFKPLMLALALESGVTRADELIDCENGSHYFGPRRVRDTHPRGELTPAEILVESSNIGMAKMLLRLVPPDTPKSNPRFQPVLDYLAQLGFGQCVLNFPGEQVGLVPRLKNFSRTYSLISLSFGHEIAVTSLQMVTAASALANGGMWRTPTLVQQVESGGQALPGPPVQERQVLRPGTCAQVRHMLARVVEDGTFADRRPRGYSVGGKTGTPEKEKDRSRISPSFFCFAPVQEPEVLVLMVVDEPRRGRFASDIVVPSAMQLLEEALKVRCVPPDRPEELDDGHLPVAHQGS